MPADCRHDWTAPQINVLFDQPFNDLLFQAQSVHREHFDPNAIQISTLLSIKTGACPEDCKYCPQSGHYHTDLKKEKLRSADNIIAQAHKAKKMGASRFCMGAAWRSLPAKELEILKTVLQEVKSLGMETCMTLGMLTQEQANALAEAGLDFYNHNLDSSPEFYQKIITTRTYDERLQTLENVRNTGMKVCCGGILGMGEARADRVGLLQQLANLPEHPQSVPINMLVAVKGTPLEDTPALDPIEFVRTVAVARIMMPHSFVRLSAGRETMSDETQALCFLAGANSIFYGEKLLTTDNPEPEQDQQLFKRLGLSRMTLTECATEMA